MLVLCLSVAALTSCLARRRVITRQGGAVSQPLVTATQAELLARISQQYDAVHDFQATVDMTPALGSTEKNKVTEFKDVRGFILFRKPADIRIIGLYPVVRNKAFDMVSTGPQFKLYIPAKNRFVVGSNQPSPPSVNKIENLRPQHFLDALLVRPLDPRTEKAVLENFTDEDNAVYILDFLSQKPDGRLLLDRSVWFDRIKLQMVRQLIFDPDGNILTDARYSNWQTYDGVPFPQHIEINRPRDEYAVVLSVVKMDINKGVSSAQFVLEQPEGTTLQVLGSPAPAAPAAASRAKGKQ